MYKDNKIVAVIPARGGSKGIKNKNMILIEDKPLIEFTLESVMNSKYIDDIYISSDSKEIHDYAVSRGCISNGLRPDYLATDKSKTIDAVIYEVGLFEEDYDLLVLLQPTQPLRQFFHIDESIVKMVDDNLESLVSVSEVEQHPVLMRKIDNDILVPFLNKNSSIRRQDFSKYYFVNGMIYINRMKDIHKNLSFNDNKTPYIIENKFFVDIDEPDDIEIFLMKLKSLNTKKK